MGEFPVKHSWNPIEDLPPNWQALSRPDLDDILALWGQERASLKDPEKVQRLEDQLATRWAIETGLIERLYTMDRGMTETLVQLGLGALQRFSTTSRRAANAAMLIEDQRAALDFVFSYIKEERPLSLSYIKELHQLLLRNQEVSDAVDQFGQRSQMALLRGEWKKLSNNPLTPDGRIHEYCPPEFVQDEMDRLLAWHKEHEDRGVRPEVEASWLHHRFTQIHPFQDGNGRVARALATMILLKAGFLPLVIRNTEHREAYISALERADDGDLGALVSLFANIEATDLNEAITFIQSMRGEGIQEIAAAAAVAARRRAHQNEAAIAETTAILIETTKTRLQEIAHDLRQAFARAGLDLKAVIVQDDPESQSWWTQQIISATRTYQYYADLNRFRRWIQLRLDIGGIGVPTWRIVVSFHHKELRTELMAAVVFMTTLEADMRDERPVILGADREFTFSSRSPAIEEQLRPWLEDALRRVLEVWQSSI